ncbi:thioesterase II family protein [Streptomyces sp. NPDC059783]|uniref:thioesterase II family protein n=1 Tax=Streptomyces sp. NPDC059783 TaxID=3346944 RepID=UPI00366458CA
MTATTATGRGTVWLSVCDGPPDGPLILVPPFAGGGRSFFREWEPLFRPWARLAYVTLPGRDQRMREPARDHLDALLPDLLDACADAVRTGPYAVFGHSMGALLGYEIACGLRARGLPEPARLVVSGLCSPDTPLPGKPLEKVTDLELLQELATIMGVPHSGPLYDLVAALLPTARADFTLCERYRWEPRPPLTSPVTALWSSDDPLTTPDGIAAWQRHTTGAFRSLRFGGPHFFIRELGGVVADELSARPGLPAPRRERQR